MKSSLFSYFFIFFICSNLFLSSCSSKQRSEETVCKKNKCSAIIISPKFLLKTDLKTEKQEYLFAKENSFKSLTKILKNFDASEITPMDFLESKSSIILKSLNNSLTFATTKTLKTITFKESYKNFSKPVSACFTSENSGAFLYKKIVLKKGEYPIQYTVSISDKNFKNWKTYTLKSNKQRIESSKIDMLETPLRIICGQNNEIYLITNIVFFQKKSTVFVYKLNQKQHFWTLVSYISGLGKGKISTFYNELQQTLYVFQKNKLYFREKDFLTKKIKMPFNGEALIFKSSDNKTIIDFLFKNDKKETVVRFMKM